MHALVHQPVAALHLEQRAQAGGLLLRRGGGEDLRVGRGRQLGGAPVSQSTHRLYGLTQSRQASRQAGGVHLTEDSQGPSHAVCGVGRAHALQQGAQQVSISARRPAQSAARLPACNSCIQLPASHRGLYACTAHLELLALEIVTVCGAAEQPLARGGVHLAVVLAVPQQRYRHQGGHCAARAGQAQAGSGCQALAYMPLLHSEERGRARLARPCFPPVPFLRTVGVVKIGDAVSCTIHLVRKHLDAIHLDNPMLLDACTVV